MTQPRLSATLALAALAACARATPAPPAHATASSIIPDPAAALGLGYYHVCLVLASNEVACWGGSLRGTAPPGMRAVQATAAHGHNCVITPPGESPRLRCWSSPWFHWTAVPAGVRDPVQVAAGDMHTCVLDRDGSVLCFGEPRTQMTPPEGFRARFIAASGLFSCAIAVDDRVVCWGFKAAPPPEGLRARYIAVASNGNFYGFDESKPNPLTKADRHACAVTLDDQVVCWGDDRDGDTDVPPGLRARQVAAGTHASCALLLDGTVQCWGRPPGANALPMPEGLHAKAIRAANDGVCAQKLDDSVVCWGDNGKQRLSQASGSVALAPRP